MSRGEFSEVALLDTRRPLDDYLSHSHIMYLASPSSSSVYLSQRADES